MCGGGGGGGGMFPTGQKLACLKPDGFLFSPDVEPCEGILAINRNAEKNTKRTLHLLPTN